MDDFPEFTTDELIKWLQAKYRRHGEIEDGVAAERLKTLSAEGSSKDEDIKLLLAVSDAARDLHKSIILDLHKHDGWMQFDFTADPIDLYWVHHLRLALQALDTSASGKQCDCGEGELTATKDCPVHGSPADSRRDPICTGCKQPFSKHIGSNLICTWPDGTPKPKDDIWSSAEKGQSDA